MEHKPVVRRSERHVLVEIDNPRDVMYWTGLWGISDQDLRDAVAAVGALPSDVSAHLEAVRARREGR